jgi:predicted enzyme related to lactoylglutathione lyase
MVLGRVLPVGLSLLILLLGVGCGGRNTPAAVGGTTSDADDIGQFAWQDLMTDDVSASRRFYGELLGWKFEETTRFKDPYLLVRSGGHLVGGIVSVEREQPDQPIAQWLSYVRVDDVKQVVEKIRQAGGKVLVSPVAVDWGMAAVVSDPQGALLGVLQSPEKLPPGLSPGRFFWHEYLTPDSAQAVSFYSDTFGYLSEVTETRGGMAYHVLRRTKPAAGIVEIRDLPVRPNWLPYVRVQDPVALASKARDLGGQVLLEPSRESRNSSLAIVADPAGAAIALQKYPF